jgi:hypothetical protein
LCDSAGEALPQRLALAGNVRAGVADQWAVRLTVPAHETLVSSVVPILLVTLRDPDKPEGEHVFGWRWRQGQDPLGPVRDLVATTQGDFRRDRTYQRIGQRGVAG